MSSVLTSEEQFEEKDLGAIVLKVLPCAYAVVLTLWLGLEICGLVALFFRVRELGQLVSVLSERLAGG